MDCRCIWSPSQEIPGAECSLQRSSLRLQQRLLIFVPCYESQGLQNRLKITVNKD